MRQLFFSVLLMIQFVSKAQLTISNGSSPSVLVDSLVGTGVTFSNVTFQGVYGTSSKYQAGLFTVSGTVATNLGFTSGIVLCTGNTSDIPLSMSTYPGSSNFTSSGLISTCANGEVRQGGSCPIYINDVDVLAGSQNYYNAAVLEFDFVPTTTGVEFQYVFGSEEYDQDDGSFSINYNCSTYNDKFGFIISGPGISGGQGYTNDGKNIALLSNGSEVSINSVNDGVVGSYGGSPSAANCTAANSSWVLGVPTTDFKGAIYGIQFNGNTKVLTATQSGLTAGATYHIKLIVTDVKDGAYDSGVFLKASSFGPPSTLPVNLLGFSAECESGYSKLEWQTASEVNNDYFIVEKSNQTFNFSPIGIVAGNGNSSVINNYEFQDFEVNNSVTYYRLKQVDFNGEFEYSNIVALSKCLETKYHIDNIYFTGNEIVISYQTNKTTNVLLNVFNSQGKLVVSKDIQLYQNQQKIRIPVSNLLSDSIYLVNLRSGSGNVSKKLFFSR
ncbi:MAG: choice-of-anchor L domain-containing protein [Flavobacteriales bacterium]